MEEKRNINKVDLPYFLLPYILWIITFNIFPKYFWFLMPISTTILGLYTLFKYRSFIKFGSLRVGLIASISLSIVLYLIFYFGNFLLTLISMAKYVENIYLMILTAPNLLSLSLILLWIGLMEEIYWRGGLQEILKNYGFSRPWLASTILYTLVHIVTLNLILIFAAFIVGIIMGVSAYKYGLFTPILLHIIWLQLIIIIIPVYPYTLS